MHKKFLVCTSTWCSAKIEMYFRIQGWWQRFRRSQLRLLGTRPCHRDWYPREFHGLEISRMEFLKASVIRFHWFLSWRTRSWKMRFSASLEDLLPWRPRIGEPETPKSLGPKPFPPTNGQCQRQGRQRISVPWNVLHGMPHPNLGISHLTFSVTFSESKTKWSKCKMF